MPFHIAQTLGMLNPVVDPVKGMQTLADLQGKQIQNVGAQQTVDANAAAAAKQKQLQQVFAQPGAFGADGKPTPATLKAVSAIDPSHAAAIAKEFGMDPNSVATIAHLGAETAALPIQAAATKLNAETNAAEVPIQQQNADTAAGRLTYDQNKPLEGTPGSQFVSPQDVKPGQPVTVPATVKTPTEQEALLAAYNADPALVQKYGAGLIGLGKYQQDQKVATAVAGRAQPSSPGDFSKTGTDFLSSIPQQWRQTVQKIANYDEDPTKVASMRGGMREQLMQWVNQVNPEYDSTLFGNRAPTRKAFTVGTQGQQINAMNTVLGHLDQMNGAIEALNHGKFVPGNEAYDYLRKTFGDASVTNFDNVKSAVAGELGKVLKGVVTEGEIARTESNIRTAGSPDQLRGAIKTNIPILGSKLAALNYQYHQAMGESDPFQALSPASKSILSKYGFDSEHPEIGGGKQSVPGRAGYTVMNDPKGVPHYVKNEEVANAPAGWSKVQ